MGYSTSGLIPVALLYRAENGLAKEEILEEMKEIDSNVFNIPKTTLYDVVKFLNLFPENIVFDEVDNRGKVWNCEYLPLYNEHVIYKRRRAKIGGGYIDSPKYKLYNIGDIGMSYETGREFRVVSRKLLRPGRHRFGIAWLDTLRKDERYDTLEKAIEQYPHLDPENIPEFDIEKGTLGRSWGDLVNRKFIWTKVGDKYQVDREQVLNELANPKTKGYFPEYGYTDLVLTLKALEHKRWEILQYKGYGPKLEAFLKECPDAKAAYDRAVWQSHTSQFGKERGLTQTELMRRRLTGDFS